MPPSPPAFNVEDSVIYDRWMLALLTSTLKKGAGGDNKRVL